MSNETHVTLPDTPLDFPMRTVIVSTEDEWAEAEKSQALEGRRIAAASNTGLPQGRYRLTFLPKSAFVDNAPDGDGGSAI